MWKQLTQKARKAIFLAQEEAGRLGYSHVASEHLLLALLREDDCVAVRILERLGLDLGTIRVQIMDHLSKGSEPLGEAMQLTGDAKAAIDLAFAEGKRMKDDWIGTEHLLLGLVRGSNDLASEVLTALGADPSEIRRQLRQLHAGTLPFEHVGSSGAEPVPASVI